MGECLKANLAVICTHTTLTYSANAHFCCCKMYNNIVDTSAAEGQMLVMKRISDFLDEKI